jgi:hypothetical protein
MLQNGPSRESSRHCQVQLRASTASAPQLVTVMLRASNVRLWWPHGTQGAAQVATHGR